MIATTRETFVPAKINQRLSEYEHRLRVIGAELLQGNITVDGAVFLIGCATDLVSGQLQRLEAMAAAGRRAAS